MKKYKISLVIGRFQPIHLSHIDIINKAKSIAEKTIIFVGSANVEASSRNPFSSNIREELIRSCIDMNDVYIVHQKDYPNDNESWKKDIINSVQSIEIGSTAIVGHLGDSSSFYLNLFPEWELIDVGELRNFHATDVRKLIFSGGDFKHMVHPNVYDKIEKLIHIEK
jgi:bifunctional NMN adenylyltransferase/nudix hydrolase